MRSQAITVSDLRTQPYQLFLHTAALDCEISAANRAVAYRAGPYGSVV